MSDLLIMAYPKVETSEDGKSYKIATVFQDIPLICLMTVPKEEFDFVEEEIETVLEHETLHLVLDVFEPKASCKLDGILPFTHSLTEVVG